MIHLPVAYLGPGAGFAFLGSFLALLVSLLASLVSFILWPLRVARAALRRGRGMRGARVRKVILIGLDGFDADRAGTLIAAGKLPNLARLSERARMQATQASGWEAFSSGARAGAPETFWKFLGRYAVGSTILLVPGSTPEEFDGRILTSETAALPRTFARFTAAEGELAGISFRLLSPEAEPELEIGDETWPLRPHVFTPWIPVRSGGVARMVRFLLTGTGAAFSLYASALHADPERPDARISHPRMYSAYLAKLLGRFATLAESGDEEALYAGAIESEDFLKQVKLAQDEREEIFLNALEHQPHGAVACVFEMPGRIERVFGMFDEVVEWSYREIDRLVGRALEHATADTAVFVVAKHARGALFSNRGLAAVECGLEDVAPTVLGLFGIKQPEWMDGRPLIHFA